MTHMDAIVARAPRSRQDRENPLGLFISIIREFPTADQTTHRRKLRNLLLSPGYEDFLDAVTDEWMRIKYSTAFRAAVPPSTKELRARAEVRKQEAAKANAAVAKAKALIGERLFNLMMPNGKPLHECTGAECVTFGGYFIKIGDAVGPREIVGKVMSASDITSLLQKRA
jgi:hypothetical protein